MAGPCRGVDGAAQGGGHPPAAAAGSCRSAQRPPPPAPAALARGAPGCPKRGGGARPGPAEGGGPGGPQEALPSPGPAPLRCRREAGLRRAAGRAAPLRLGSPQKGDAAAADAMSWRSGSRGVVLTAYHPSGGGDPSGG